MQFPALPAALYCHPDPARAREATVTFRGDGVEIRWADGARLVPPAELRLSLGGLDGDRLLLEWGEGDDLLHLQADPAPLAVELPRIADRDLKRRLLELMPVAADRRRAASSLGWRLTGYAAAFLLALWLAWGPLLAFAVGRIPASWERSLGKGAASQLLAGRVEVKEGDAHRDLAALFARLVAATDAPHCEFALHLVRDDQVNAFALPGGTVIVHTALLEKSRSAEEVAGVLAHEIEHALRRHGMRRIVNGLGVGAVATIFLGDVGSLVSVAQQAALELGMKSYDRDQEREADAGAVDRLARAGIDPRPFADFFERLAAEGEGLPSALSWFSTHPSSVERAARVRELAERATGGDRPRPLPYSFHAPAAK